MKYGLVVRPEVADDLQEAQTWYEARQPGLGAKFLNTMRDKMASLPEQPLQYRVRHRRLQVRFAYPRVFPYRIVFAVLDDTVVIYAVIHSARHNRHWRNRV